MINIVSYNVRGIAGSQKRQNVFKFLKNKYHDVILLQEVHSVKKIEKIWRAQFGGQILYCHGTSNARGCAILIKRGIKTVIHKIIKPETEGRCLIIDISVDNLRMTLCNVYAPNTDSPEFFVKMFDAVRDLKNEHVIIGGDFNTVLSTKEKRGGSSVVGHPKAVKVIDDNMLENSLIDIWRMRNPEKNRFTWHKKNPSLVFERLDFFLVSTSLSSLILDADIDPAFLSDHSLPHITLRSILPDCGPGFWRLNMKLLEDEVFNSEVVEILEKNSMKYADTKLRWEMCKMDVRGLAIRNAARRKKSIKNKLEVLFRKQTQIQNDMDNDESQFVDHYNQLALVTKDIEEIVQKQARFSTLQNQINWHMYGEKCSKYFLALEKNKSKTPLTRLQIEGKVVDDEDNILEELRRFYLQLFTAVTTENVDSSYFDSMELPKISQEDKTLLEEPIQLAEVEIAVNQLKLGKCPGIDGLPIEFYRTFVSKLKHMLHVVILKSVQEGEFVESSKLGIISLLEKVGKDQLQIGNWRPLSLLCCDFKVFTKIIANRLQLVIDDLISSDQCGFLKGRFIAQNLMDVNAVIYTAEKNNIPASLVAIDFAKAYDSVSWVAMDRILELYNFGPKFIDLIRLTRAGISGRVLNNGFLSDTLPITRGLRQGDPLSCGLFDLVIEVIGHKIRNNANIEGVMVGQNATKKLGQYADDLWVAVKHKRECYLALFRELDSFERNVGLKVNYDKTEILRIGSLRDTDALYFSGRPLHWSDGTIRVLGIHIGNDQKLVGHKNYKEILEKATSVLTAWSKRSLTLLGKIEVVNTLVASLFSYRLQVLPSPSDQFMKEYQKIVTKFLWDGKRPKIAYKKLTLSYEQGGLKLSDLKLRDLALKVKWVQQDRFNQLSWSELLRVEKDFGKDIWWKCNLSKKDVKNIMRPSVFTDIYKAWAHLNFCQPTSKEQVLSQPLWFNSCIKDKSKVVYIKAWSDKGVNFVKQLVDANHCKFKTCEQLWQEFGKVINVIDLTRIINAIPKEWLAIIRHDIKVEIVKPGIEVVKSNIKCSAVVYKEMLTRQKSSTEVIRSKWENVLCTEINDKEWHNM